MRDGGRLSLIVRKVNVRAKYTDIPHAGEAWSGGEPAAAKAPAAKKKYRCKVCGAEFEADYEGEPVCPLCMAKGDDLEEI